MIVDGVQVKSIPNFPNYAISKDGQVWSKPRKYCNPVGKWLTPGIGWYGHLSFVLRKKGKSHTIGVHRLLLETYVSPCPIGMECRHLDGNPKNNQLENLTWGTEKENQQDRKRHGTSLEGIKHPMVKLTEQDVRMIVYIYRTGLFSQKEIAIQYNITRPNVTAIVNRKTWKHIWAA